MARPVAKVLAIFAVLAAVLVLGALLLALRSPAQPDPLPNPNGYDDLIKAGEALQDVDYSALQGVELRTVLSNNAAALKLARSGLGRDSRVPLEYKPESPQFQDLRFVKGLAQAFVAEGRLAEAESRPADAVQSYLTAMRVGQASTRGGVIIHALVGIAVEALGLVRLEKLAPTLDAKTARELAAALEQIDSQREPVQVTLQQEHDWARRTHGLKAEILRLLPSLRKVEQVFRNRADAQAKRIQGLMIGVAAQAYQLERGQPPANIGELVPAYLKSIPRDPSTQTNASLPRVN